MRITYITTYLFIILFSVQCIEDTTTEFRVFTEDVLYVSGERLRSTGRVLSIGQEDIQDHGFIIASNESFTSPVFITLGPTNLVGRFVGETSALDFVTGYFCKAYLVVKGDTIFGNVKSFTTLGPSLEDYSPKLGLAGQRMIINGRNFTEDTKIFFDDIPAEIIELNFESEVIVEIPEIGEDHLSRVSVRTLDRQLHFPDTFEYIFGKWEFVRDFPEEEQRSLTTYFVEGDEFILGLGQDGNFIDSNTFWAMDLNTFERREIPFDGEPMRGAFFSDGYFGVGLQGQGPFSRVINDFYRYSNGTFEKLATPPFSGQYGKSAFTINNVLYVVGAAFEEATFKREVWAYDTATQQWTLHDEAPIDIIWLSSYFVGNDRAYFISNSGEVWEYDPASKDWRVVATFPGEAKQEAFNLVLNGKAYIGLQGNDWQTFTLNEINVWEFDLQTYKWRVKLDFPGNPTYRVNAFFHHADKLYIMRYDFRGGGHKKMELWSFDPAALR